MLGPAVIGRTRDRPWSDNGRVPPVVGRHAPSKDVSWAQRRNAGPSFSGERGNRGSSAAVPGVGCDPKTRRGARTLRSTPSRSDGSLHCAIVAGERVKLTVRNRTTLGSAEARRLRRAGLIPGVLYGREEPVAITIPERDLRAALTTRGGLNAVLDVVVEGGKTHSSVLKEFQTHKVRGHITHVDLQEVRLDQPIHATVPLTLHGEAAGVKEGGVLSQVTNELNVEALPMEVPEHLEIDVSAMHIGDTLRLSALSVP